jgi:hypothetical protein
MGNACCELLGFDVLLEKEKDGSIKPWLLEVNHAPSLNIDTPTDRSTKFKLLCDTFKILRLRPHITKRAEREHARERLMSKSIRTETRQVLILREIFVTECRKKRLNVKNLENKKW